MSRIHLEIVTPEKRAYSDDVDGVVLPGSEGLLGVLPGHTPLMAMITPGVIEVKKSDETNHLAVGEGFAEITGSRVIVLTDMAIEEEQIDESKVEEALKRAEEALAAASHNPEEAEKLAAAIQKSVAQLNLKRRRRS